MVGLSRYFVIPALVLMLAAASILSCEGGRDRDTQQQQQLDRPSTTPDVVPSPSDTTRTPGDTMRMPGDTMRMPGDTTRMPGDTSRQPDTGRGGR